MPESASDGDMADRMERAMEQMGERIQSLDDEDADPREAVRVMREIAAAGGLNFNAEVREAMARIEAGEDPEKIEQEFAEVFETENPFAEEDSPETGGRAVALWRRLRGPRRDPAWYELHPFGTENDGQKSGGARR